MDSHFTVRGMIVAQTQSTPLRFKLCRAVDGEGLAKWFASSLRHPENAKKHMKSEEMFMYIYIYCIYI